MAALLGACGGADDGTEGAVKFAGQMRAASAAAPGVAVTAATTVTADMTLDWAEYKFPDLFPKAVAIKFPSIEYEGVTYNARAYPGAWGMRYLGITPDGRIFGLGDFTGQALQQFNDIAHWSAQIVADQCSVHPDRCGNPPAGPLNECADPAAAALTAGLRSRLVYEFTGGANGEQTVESVIEGPSIFEGQDAIKINSQVSGTSIIEGTPVNTSVKVETYEQLGSSGVTLTLGSLVEISVGDITDGDITLPGTVISSTKTVYTPPSQNLEFHLALGQTGTITSTSTTTTLAGFPGMPLPPPSTSTISEVYTFQAKEPVTVLAGTYATCRYRIDGDNANSFTTTWFIVGKGIPAKSETRVDGVVTDTQQLKSGTYNDAPL